MRPRVVASPHVAVLAVLGRRVRPAPLRDKLAVLLHHIEGQKHANAQRNHRSLHRDPSGLA